MLRTLVLALALVACSMGCEDSSSPPSPTTGSDGFAPATLEGNTIVFTYGRRRPDQGRV